MSNLAVIWSCQRLGRGYLSVGMMFGGPFFMTLFNTVEASVWAFAKMLVLGQCFAVLVMPQGVAWPFEHQNGVWKTYFSSL